MQVNDIKPEEMVKPISSATNENPVQQGNLSSTVGQVESNKPQTVKKGRFWVTEDHQDDEDDEEAEAVPIEQETKVSVATPEKVGEIPPLEQATEVRGRFVVTVTKEQDDDDGEDSEPPTPQQAPSSIVDTKIIDDTKAAPNKPPQGEASKVVPPEVVRKQSQTSVQTTQQGMQRQRQNTTNAGPPTMATVVSELQRISQQNYKLHSMLRDLSVEKKVSPSQGYSAGISSTSVKLNVASAADTSHIQHLVTELQTGTGTLITEYDTLKSKNHMLNKQLKDVKQQLKEANQVISTLKENIARKDAKIEKLEGKNAREL